MVLTTFKSSKINTLESPSQLNEIRPIPAANELPLLTILVGERPFFVYSFGSISDRYI